MQTKFNNPNEKRDGNVFENDSRCFLSFFPRLEIQNDNLRRKNRLKIT